MREVLSGEPLDAGRIAIGLGGGAVMVALAVGYSSWMLRVFRRRGLVTRFS
jgi:hypothetical protein